MKRHYSSKILTALEQLFSGEDKNDDIPMTTLGQETVDPFDEKMDRYLCEIFISFTISHSGIFHSI